MRLFTSLFLATAVGLAQAQTPAGFLPQVNNKLHVQFNTTAVNSPGLLLSKAVTATEPYLALPVNTVNASQTFIFMMLDLDVPPANGSTQRRVLLHAMKKGLKPMQQKVGSTLNWLTTSEQGPVAYLPPGPPPTDTVAHRYVQLLFEQPSTLTVKASDFPTVQSRINFDVQYFMHFNGVKPPIAANFFRVDGRANATGSANGTGGVPGNTTISFEGAAVVKTVPLTLLSLLLGVVLFGA